jgi:hypothetical protein
MVRKLKLHSDEFFLVSPADAGDAESTSSQMKTQSAPRTSTLKRFTR